MTLIQRSTAVALGVGLLFAAACGGGEDHQPAVTLRVWQTETDKSAVEQLHNTIRAFEASHPGVHVELEPTSWSGLSSKLTLAIQAGTPPDICHLEPFMAASMWSQGLLRPIDGVIDAIEKSPTGKFMPCVRDLQLFDGARYGIAYAVGTTGFAYRKDLADRLGLSTPTTWNEYIAFAGKMHQESNGRLGVLLPGGDPFFIDQLFAELVANNGGILFDPHDFYPQLSSKPVVETLELFERLAPFVDPGWQTQTYLDQFQRLGRGEAGNVPVCYARASKAIEAAVASLGPTSTLRATPDIFAWMPQPVGPSNRRSSPIATIDCEPFAVFKAAESRSAGKYGSNALLAEEFLVAFFERDRYLAFVRNVPIHLTPVFDRLATSDEYRSAPLCVTWRPWETQTNAFLRAADGVRPILMPDATEAGRKLPFLLECQNSRIFSQAVASVIKRQATPVEAAEAAQRSAEKLLTTLGFRKWSSK